MRDLRRIDKEGAIREATAARAELARLRDEARVRIHLGRMELRDAFDQIEREADQLLARAEPVAARTIHGLSARLRRLVHALDRKQ